MAPCSLVQGHCLIFHIASPKLAASLSLKATTNFDLFNENVLNSRELGERSKYDIVPTLTTCTKLEVKAEQYLSSISAGVAGSLLAPGCCHRLFPSTPGMCNSQEQELQPW